jgi:hypothetical protein
VGNIDLGNIMPENVVYNTAANYTETLIDSELDHVGMNSGLVAMLPVIIQQVLGDHLACRCPLSE